MQAGESGRYAKRRGSLFPHSVLIWRSFYPCVWINRKDLRGLPLTRRKRALTGLVPATTTVLSQVFSVDERGRDLFDAVERLDLEGIVAKRKRDAY